MPLSEPAKVDEGSLWVVNRGLCRARAHAQRVDGRLGDVVESASAGLWFFTA